MHSEIIVVDGFYHDPDRQREYALGLDYNISGNYPGLRTVSDENELRQVRNHVESILQTKVVNWSAEKTGMANGAYQICTKDSGDTWIHADRMVWSCMVYLSPDPPKHSGIKFWQHDATGKRYYDDEDGRYLEDEGSQWDKWTETDEIQNIYNRAVFFRGNLWHCSSSYFGDSLETGRLFQTFFFDV